MRKLLRANFSRLKKSKVFWIGIALMVLWAAYGCINSYIEQMRYSVSRTLDMNLFNFAPVIGLFCAAFCSLFIGTEYSDGTIRNKLVVGHRRSNIYLSMLLVSIAAGILMSLTYLAVTCILGIPLFGMFHMAPTTALALLLCSFVMTAAFCGIFTLLCMLNQNKAVSAVLCIVLAFLLLFAAVYIQSRLEEPELYSGYSLSVDGSIQMSDPEPNPFYLQGTRRQIYEFLNDFLPGSQGILIAQSITTHLWRLPLYSLLIAAITTGIGICLFRKKDLK